MISYYITIGSITFARLRSAFVSSVPGVSVDTVEGLLHVSYVTFAIRKGMNLLHKKGESKSRSRKRNRIQAQLTAPAQ